MVVQNKINLNNILKRMKEYFKYFRISIIMILFDFITKMLAILFLEYRKPINVVGNEFILFLTYNNTSSNNFISQNVKENSNNGSLILMSVFGIIISVYIYLVSKLKFKKFFKILFGFFLFLIFFSLNEIFKPYIASYKINNYATSIISMLGPLVLLFIIFILIKNEIIRYLILGMFSFGLGNFINLFYPPFGVVDFLYIGILDKYFSMGVCNIADFGYLLAIIILFIFLIFESIRKIINKIMTNLNKSKN